MAAKAELQLVITALDKTKGALQGIGKSFQGLGQSMTRLGKSMTAKVTLPLLGLGAVAVKTAASFETQMADMKVAAGDTGASIDQLREYALKMGADTFFSASEAAEAMTNLLRAGETTEQIMGDMTGTTGMLAAAMDLAAASDLELAQASDAVSVALATFGDEAGSAREIAQSFVSAADASVAEVSELAAALVNIGPTAAGFSWELADVNTALAILSQRGIRGSQAGTALKSMMTNLMRPTDDVTETLRDLGIELYNAEDKLKTLPEIIGDLSAALMGEAEVTRTVTGRTAEQSAQLKRLESDYKRISGRIEDYELGIKGVNLSEDARAKKLNELRTSLSNVEGAMEPLLSIQDRAITSTRKLTEAQRHEAIQTLAGTYGMTAMNALLAEGSEGWEAMAGAIGDAASVEEIAATKMDTFEGSVESLRGSLETLMIQAGTPLIDEFLRPAVDWLGEVATAFTNLSPGTQKTILTLLGVAAALGPILIIGGQVVAAIGTLISVFGALSGFISGAVTIISTAIAGLGASILPIIAVIAAVVGLLYLAWKHNFLGIRDVIAAVKEIIVDLIGRIKDTIMVFWKFLTGEINFEEMLGEWAGIWEGFGEKLSECWEKIKTAVSEGWDRIKEWFSNAKEKIVEIVSNLVDAVVGFFKELWQKLVGGSIIGDIVEGALSLFAALKEGLLRFGQSILDGLLSIWEDIKAGIVSRWEAIKTTVVTIVESAVSNVVAKFSELRAKVVEKLRELKARAVEAFEELKSSVLDKATALQEGITTKVAALKNKVLSHLGALRAGAISRFNKMRSVCIEKFQALVSAVKKRARKILDSVINTLDDVRTFISNFDLSEVGRGLIESLKSGIMAAAQGVIDAASQVVSNAIGAAKAALGWGSSSKVFIDLGEAISTSLAKGIDKAAPKPISVMRGVVTELSKETLGELNDLSKTMGSILDNLRGAGEALSQIAGLELGFPASIFVRLQEGMAEGLAVLVRLAESLAPGAAQAAAELADQIKDLWAVLASAVDTLAKIKGLDPTFPVGVFFHFRDQMRRAVMVLARLAEELAPGAAQAAAELADQIKDLWAVLASAIDTLAKIKGLEPTFPVGVFFHFRDQMRRAINVLATLATDLSPQAVASAAAMAESIKEVWSVLTAAADFMIKLATIENLEFPIEIFQRLAWTITSGVSVLSEIARSMPDEVVKAASDFALAVADVWKVLSSAADFLVKLAGLSELVFPSSIFETLRSTMQRSVLLLAELATNLSPQAVEAATLLAGNISGIWSVLSSAIDTISKLAEADLDFPATVFESLEEQILRAITTLGAISDNVSAGLLESSSAIALDLDVAFGTLQRAGAALKEIATLSESLPGGDIFDSLELSMMGALEVLGRLAELYAPAWFAAVEKLTDGLDPVFRTLQDAARILEKITQIEFPRAWAPIREDLNGILEEMMVLAIRGLGELERIILAAGQRILVALASIWQRMHQQVRAAFSGLLAAVSGFMGAFPEIGATAGRSLMVSLARAIRRWSDLPRAELEAALVQLASLLPSSDAQRGPLSKLSSQGAALGSTFAEGMARGQRKIISEADRTAAALMARLAGVPAGLGLSGASVAVGGVPAAPAAPVPALAQPGPQRSLYNYGRITIQAAPGEDPETLWTRLFDYAAV